MGFALRLVAAVALAVIIGAGSAYYSILWGQSDSAVANGPWRTNLATGGAGADEYTRAFIALTGLLALNKDETLYYNAETDSAGETLSGDCTYRIEGRDADARWWSITLYGRDHFLIANDANRYSVGKSNVVRGGDDGGFVVRLSPVPEQGNWIATSPDGFQITLRLYNPGSGLRENPATAPLPAIMKETCS